MNQSIAPVLPISKPVLRKNANSPEKNFLIDRKYNLTGRDKYVGQTRSTLLCIQEPLKNQLNEAGHY